MNFDSSLYISKFTSAERSQFWYYYHFVIQTFSLSHLKCGTSQGKCLLWEKSCSVCSTEVLLLRVRVSKCPWICPFRDGRACKTRHNPSTQHAGTYRWTAVWSESPWWLGGWVCSQWRCHWTQGPTWQTEWERYFDMNYCLHLVVAFEWSKAIVRLTNVKVYMYM